jgi:antitoxin component of MazEF toxin-antitoxin module
MVPIPEEIMEHIRWNSDTQLYMRFQDGQLLISETNYSEENVNANIQAYYDQIGNGC